MMEFAARLREQAETGAIKGGRESILPADDERMVFEVRGNETDPFPLFRASSSKSGPDMEDQITFQ